MSDGFNWNKVLSTDEPAPPLLLSLLGTAEPDELRAWFDPRAEDGAVLEPLAGRPWNAWDGRVRDRCGVCWVIGRQLGEG